MDLRNSNKENKIVLRERITSSRWLDVLIVRSFSNVINF